jgi:hypothetical protein
MGHQKISMYTKSVGVNILIRIKMNKYKYFLYAIHTKVFMFVK